MVLTAFVVFIAVMLIIAGYALFQDSKNHIKKLLEENTDPTNSVLTAKDAKELTDESNRKTIEAQFNEIMGYIKEECALGKSEFIRYKMLPEVQEKLEHLGYTIEVIYDDNDSIVDNEYHFVIKW
jgi:hypothetical protein